MKLIPFITCPYITLGNNVRLLLFQRGRLLLVKGAFLRSGGSFSRFLMPVVPASLDDPLFSVVLVIK